MYLPERDVDVAVPRSLRETRTNRYLGSILGNELLGNGLKRLLALDSRYRPELIKWVPPSNCSRLSSRRMNV